MYEGTIYMKASIGIVWRHILYHQDDIFQKVVTRTHSACATTAWFRRHVDVTDWPADLSPIENVWPIMKRRIIK